ncbi:MAG: RidA family protein [Pseudomonadota bacterium]|nr:RidA family protein [Pseudomonadota bacterium]
MPNAGCKREILQSRHLPKPLYNYSQMVRIGSTYQLAGQIALLDGKLIGGGVEAECEHILTAVAASLPDFGLTLEDMLAATIYTTCLDKFANINQAWERFFATTTAPARTTVGVSSLPLAAALMMEFRFCKYD